MKWFKHENTFNNPKVKLLKRKHKAQGYAVYFQILELIGDALDQKNREDWFYLPIEYSDDLEFLADELGVELKELTDILGTCYKIDLLQEDKGRIKCIQLKERADEYTEKILKNKPKSEETPDSVGTTSGIRREEDKNKKKKRKDKEQTREEHGLTSIRNESFRRKSLEEITEDDLEEIGSMYHVPRAFVESKLDDLRNYCDKTGKTYKDYKAALRDWVKKDALERREHGNSKIKYVGEPLTE